jgi:hypothetical protein
MKIKTMTTFALTALAVVGASAMPAQARPPHHPKKVCRVVHDHGHVKKVCRWVR